MSILQKEALPIQTKCLPTVDHENFWRPEGPDGPANDSGPLRLSEAFDGIATAKANAEQNLQNARALFESHLQSVFNNRGEGWGTRKVSEVAMHSLGKMLDKAKNKGDPQPYLRNL